MKFKIKVNFEKVVCLHNMISLWKLFGQFFVLRQSDNLEIWYCFEQDVEYSWPSSPAPRCFHFSFWRKQLLSATASISVVSAYMCTSSSPCSSLRPDTSANFDLIWLKTQHLERFTELIVSKTTCAGWNWWAACDATDSNGFTLRTNIVSTHEYF